MRAPTVPEAHLAAVVLLAVAASLALYLAPAEADPWLWPVALLCGITIAAWLRRAWRMMRLQRRLKATWTVLQQQQQQTQRREEGSQ